MRAPCSRAAWRRPRKQGGNIANSVAMGYCFGGSAVLEWARAGVDLKGFVSFHGGLETPVGRTTVRSRATCWFCTAPPMRR